MTADSDPVAALCRALGADLTALAMLSAEDSAELLRLFERARVGRRAALDQTITDTLRRAPRPLRGAARRILFGADHDHA